MRLVFMGTPAAIIPALAALHAAPGLAVAGVYTAPDRPRGRGRAMEPTPAKAAALGLGLPVFQPHSFRPAAARQELAALQPDIAVVAAYGRLLPPEVLAIPPHGCLNLHPSLLPRYRGPSPVATAILDGAPSTGVTLMLLDAGMDTGPILAQEEYPLTGRETAADLTDTLFELGTQLLLDNLEPWVSGQLTAQPQDETLATLTRKLERADGIADWRLPAAVLERMIRAFTPWPGLTASWQGQSLRLLAATAIDNPDDPTAAPGVVVALPLSETPAAIGTGQGLLALKEVQLAGRRPARIADFLRGYPDFIGSQLD